MCVLVYRQWKYYFDFLCVCYLTETKFFILRLTHNTRTLDERQQCVLGRARYTLSYLAAIQVKLTDRQFV